MQNRSCQEDARAERERLDERDKQAETSLVAEWLGNIVRLARRVKINVDVGAEARLRNRITILSHIRSLYLDAKQEVPAVDEYYIAKLVKVIESKKTQNIDDAIKLAELPKGIIEKFSTSSLRAGDLLLFQRLDDTVNENGVTPTMVLSKLVEGGVDIKKAVEKLETATPTELQAIHKHRFPVAVFLGYNKAQLDALDRFCDNGLTYEHFKDHSWFKDDIHVRALGYLLNNRKSKPAKVLNQLSNLNDLQREAVANGLQLYEVDDLTKNELLKDFLSVYKDLHKNPERCKCIRDTYKFFTLNKFQQKAILKFASEFNDEASAVSYFSGKWFNSDNHGKAFFAITKGIQSEHLLRGVQKIDATKLILQDKTVDEAAVLDRAYRSSDTDMRAQIMHDLQMYIERIELTALASKDRKTINFEHNFWFFKASRAHNREANYKLAIQLRDALSQRKKDSDIKDVFRSKNIRALRDPFKPTRGIYSSELNAVIQKASKM